MVFGIFVHLCTRTILATSSDLLSWRILFSFPMKWLVAQRGPVGASGNSPQPPLLSCHGNPAECNSSVEMHLAAGCTWSSCPAFTFWSCNTQFPNDWQRQRRKPTFLSKICKMLISTLCGTSEWTLDVRVAGPQLGCSPCFYYNIAFPWVEAESVWSSDQDMPLE